MVLILRDPNVAVHARPTSRPIESECDERGTIGERLVVGRSMEPLVGPEIHSGCSVRLSEWGTLPHAEKSDLIYGHWQNPCRRSFAIACQNSSSHAKESRLPSIRFVASKRISAVHLWDRFPCASNVTVQRTTHLVRRTLQPLVRLHCVFYRFILPIDRTARCVF